MKTKYAILSIVIVLSLSIMVHLAEEASALPMAQMADDIGVEMGKRRLTFDGNSSAKMVIFEEIHTSRSGQVEIAIMLNRLYHRYGVRHLALEGAVENKDQLNTKWFYSLSDGKIRNDVALRLFKEGEVNAAEFIAMVYKDFQLHSVEKKDEYSVDISNEAERAPRLYLFAIAAKLLTPAQIREANSMISQNKKDEAAEYIMNANPWTSERYKLLKNTDLSSLSLKSFTTLANELETKAKEVKADVRQYEKDFKDYKRFFITAEKRNDTMVKKAISVAQKSPKAPIVILTGALHTEGLTNLLKAKGISYAVVSPNSLGAKDKKGDLAYDGPYRRKLESRSIDPSGGLGSFLDGRRKPPPVLDTPWFDAKARIMYAATVIARTCTGGGGIQIPPNEPPFNNNDLGLGDEKDPNRPIRIDRGTVRTVYDKNKKPWAVFRVDFLTKGVTKSFWMSVQVIKEDPSPKDQESAEKSLEAQLKRILNELETVDSTGDKEMDESSEVLIAIDVKAHISRTEQGAIKAAQESV
jgi:hypothetical protein